MSGIYNIFLKFSYQYLCRHPILRDLLLIFSWVANLLFSRLLSFDFCCDFDSWAQGQALRAFFVVMRFFDYFIKSMMWILIKHDRKLRRHLAHDHIIVDLHLRKMCRAKTSCLVN